MNENLNWRPRASDIDWIKRLFDACKADIAVWGIPANNALYKIDRAAKTLTLMEGPEESMGCNLFHRLTVICAMIGWTTHRAPAGTVITNEMREEAFGLGKNNARL